MPARKADPAIARPIVPRPSTASLVGAFATVGLRETEWLSGTGSQARQTRSGGRASHHSGALRVLANDRANRDVQQGGRILSPSTPGEHASSPSQLPARRQRSRSGSGWAAAPGQRPSSLRHSPGIVEGSAQQHFEMGIEAAELIGRPLGKGVVDRGVNSQQ